MAKRPRDTDTRHCGPEHASPYPVSRLAAPISLVDAAREIEHADVLIKAGTEHELLAIAEQVRALQDRARQVVERAQRDSELHRAACNFTRVVGKTYHLYERENGKRFFSMLSPEEWGDAAPHTFVGSYRLEADQRWTPTTEAESLDARRADLERALGGQRLPPRSDDEG